jgi:hypothetical protein
MRKLIQFPVFLFFFCVSQKAHAGYCDHRNPGVTDRHRLKPVFVKQFNGDLVTAYLGGMRGKYFRHYCLAYKQPIPCAEKKLLPLPVAQVCKDTVPDIIPSKLYAHFQANSDSIINLQETIQVMKGLANYMSVHASALVMLTGNTGTNLEDKNAPLGNTAYVLDYPAILNGKKVSTEELMRARAAAIKSILVNHYHLDATRIQIQAGGQSKGEGGRNVGVEVSR